MMSVSEGIKSSKNERMYPEAATKGVRGVIFDKASNNLFVVSKAEFVTLMLFARF